MRIIENKNFPNERDLYGEKDITLINCTFSGVEDGESALKESKDITLKNCIMNLRYPLWHDNNVLLVNCEMTDKCRAALWYTENIKIYDSKMFGIKALRECSNIYMQNVKIESHEFGWKSKNIKAVECEINSEYPFFEATDIDLENINLTGKYSFQYTENLTINNSVFNTKDSFWHAKNVTVKDTIIKGEYLGWYSDRLTLERCRIIGTQPFCYCKNLTLIDCEMEDTDLSFEYSDVHAQIIGNIVSIKNPKSGIITSDGIDEVILTDDSKYKCECKIQIRNK
ncbi:MAG: DUF3737 family protein [Clostridia bacterium]|nr:DUF3737 family protein [Clostridia bacterium]